jgi:hypothetical protein
VLEQRALDLEAAREARQRAAGSDEPVAWQHDRQGVAGVRGPDGTGAVRPSEAPGLVPVRPRGRERHRLQLNPGAALERGPAEGERNVERRACAGEVLGDLALGGRQHGM